MQAKYTIALVGRTNVGKSTLFNKLIEENKAIVSDKPNTTRDRNYGSIIWRGESVRVIDTGGLDAFVFLDNAKSDNFIEKQILEQTNASLLEADLVLMVVDMKYGILPQERKLAEILKRIKKPTLLVGNKIDSTKAENEVDQNELLKLNVGMPVFVSGKSGRAAGDLLDEIFKRLAGIKKKASKNVKLAEKITPIKITLIGKPNVGKSSMLNAILGHQQAIVSPIEHTTREPHDVSFNYKEQPFVLIDTAGIRKYAKMKRGIEKFGVEKSLLALQEADVAILVVDVSKPLSSQDNHLAAEIRKSGCGLIIAANKWDLVEAKGTNSTEEFKKIFYASFPFLWWAPIEFVSALTKQRVKNILDESIKISQRRKQELRDSELEVFTKKFIEFFKPIKGRGSKNPRVRSLTQAKTAPPGFVLSIYPGADLNKAYLRYVENQIRKTFDFKGVPMSIYIDKPKKRHSVAY
jgi:GTP-binding protein